ncbi:Chlororespiratory reduction 7 isoform 2 [Theobroma cacao]|uniref:Chlororespiratory reduction 7 isoform 2 n=1 Tax=Theobroma cacao TaxID=3641 RepID=A0A061EFD9_THECC|nr:Chlororespiratory reduction 7 isoform 2 [Theobroma cacao]
MSFAASRIPKLSRWPCLHIILNLPEAFMISYALNHGCVILSQVICYQDTLLYQLFKQVQYVQLRILVLFMTNFLKWGVSIAVR